MGQEYLLRNSLSATLQTICKNLDTGEWEGPASSPNNPYLCRIVDESRVNGAEIGTVRRLGDRQGGRLENSEALPSPS